ncbi:hypothetical protein Cgig2_009613 [Carnegiea gigantea]|uniref:Plant bHLH transcription factor ACT-like domain-containing protein n=1 Tax=Carnegiea gigantea TaxID=171969 RepID=A0A9Q1Q837_9CARY|nr:hypothetical protein Cgig2_009613 [Carnegiea gigantea]
MVSREQKRAALEEKYQHLRSVTNSNAVNKASILVDASKYIKDLKQKVERLNQDISFSGSSSRDDQDDQTPLIKVRVETLEKGFLINVFSETSCPGLLVSILEALEELGLEVLDARVSCADCFQLEAVGEENEGEDSLDAQVVKQAVLQAIKNWRVNT